MPSEKFFDKNVHYDRVALTVAWEDGGPGIDINGVEYDHTAIRRLRKVLRRALRKTGDVYPGRIELGGPI